MEHNSSNMEHNSSNMEHNSSNANEILLHNIKDNNIHNYCVKLYKKYSNDPILVKHFKDTNTKVDILFIDGAHDYNGEIHDWKN